MVKTPKLVPTLEAEEYQLFRFRLLLKQVLLILKASETIAVW